MVSIGLTHCRKCFHPLKDNEFGICNDCKMKENQKENEKKEEILSIFYNMNDYERKALQEFISKIGKEYKIKSIKKNIEKLQKQLKDEE